MAPFSYVKTRISGTTKYSSPMFHYEVPFWLMCRKYMLLIRVWVFYDKKMVVALVEKHSKKMFWKLIVYYTTRAESWDSCIVRSSGVSNFCPCRVYYFSCYLVESTKTIACVHWNILMPAPTFALCFDFCIFHNNF